VPVCSYLVFPRRGRSAHAAAALAAIPGCDVTPAESRELLVLVTSSADVASEESLRAAVEAVEDVECLALSFGEIQSESCPARPRGRSDGIGNREAPLRRARLPK
jgi:nitrate reductase NapAB chaperone NapD